MKAGLGIELRAVGVRRGATWALREVSWTLKPGERWALLGDNGAGKTQMLKLLAGDVWPTPGRGRGGRIYRQGADQVDVIEARAHIAYVGAEQQDKYTRYGWNLRVGDLVTTGLHRTDLLLRPASREESRRVTATLRACGLLRSRDREFMELSYGQKRLALLARALVQRPQWLLLDEFYNGLDAHFRRRMDALLAAARRRGQSWVACAHRAMDVPPGTRLLLELDAGRIRAMRAFTTKDRRQLERRAGESPAATAGRRPRSGGAVIIRLAEVNLFVHYRAVLRSLDWRIRRGEQWAVYGANGAGKSSLLKLLYGDLSPALGGSIERAGFLPGAPISEWKRRVGYVSPELQSDYAIDVTLLDLVASGRHASIGLNEVPSAQDRRVAVRWLKFFDLLACSACRPRELSYGQLRRALMARAMAAQPELLLLDEPLTGLDAGQRALMKRLLAGLMRRVTLIVAVHHAEDLPRGMTHGLRLHNRRAQPVDSYSAT